jgi:DNA primase
MLDFHTLKQRVSLERVLQSYGLLTNIPRRGHRLAGPCPIHRGDNPTAFRADLDRNLWNCFTVCGGGDVVDLVRAVEHCDHAAAARILAGLVQGTSAPAPPVSTPSSPSSAFRPFTFRIPLDPRCDFLQHKGISVDTATRFEAGTTRRSSFLRDSVAVRLHDLDGKPLGYCGRRLRQEDIHKWGKWRFPSGFPKALTLFGAHRAWPHRAQGIVVVECPWGVMRLSQAGLPAAVALLGTSASHLQLRWLAQAPFVYLLLDGDAPGRAAARQLARQLSSLTSVEVLDLPDGSDPDDLPENRLRSLIPFSPSS